MPTIDELTAEARDVALLVHTAQEQSDEREKVIAAHQGVDRLSQRYRELLASLGEMERMKVERTLGRRVTDLRRLASALPRIGNIDTTPDRQVTGPSLAGERRITGVSWRSDNKPPPSPAARVGGEIEAWCGPCDRMTTHKIIAMVGNTPKQVVCDACGGRHGYRTSPARKGSESRGGAVDTSPRASSQTLEAARKAEQKAEELRALGREVAAAPEVKQFNPRERYRPGDVISHPDFGRGKVETVLRASLLVRFPNGGLKSLLLL
jgi:hypothetical protein